MNLVFCFVNFCWFQDELAAAMQQATEEIMPWEEDASFFAPSAANDLEEKVLLYFCNLHKGGSQYTLTTWPINECFGGLTICIWYIAGKFLLGGIDTGHDVGASFEDCWDIASIRIVWAIVPVDV